MARWRTEPLRATEAFEPIRSCKRPNRRAHQNCERAALCAWTASSSMSAASQLVARHSLAGRSRVWTKLLQNGSAFQVGRGYSTYHDALAPDVTETAFDEQCPSVTGNFRHADGTQSAFAGPWKNICGLRTDVSPPTTSFCAKGKMFSAYFGPGMLASVRKCERQT